MKRKKKDPQTLEFNSIVSDIRDMVYPHLENRHKRHLDEIKLRSLGGKVKKQRSMPYNELIQRDKALKKTISKQKSLEKQLGVTTQYGKYRDLSQAITKKKNSVKKKHKNKQLFGEYKDTGVHRVKKPHL